MYLLATCHIHHTCITKAKHNHNGVFGSDNYNNVDIIFFLIKKITAMLLMQKNSHKHQQLTLLSNACKGLKLKETTAPPWPLWSVSVHLQTGGSSAMSISIFTTDVTNGSLESILSLLEPEPAMTYLNFGWKQKRGRWLVTFVTLTGLLFLHICFQL